MNKEPFPHSGRAEIGVRAKKSEEGLGWRENVEKALRSYGSECYAGYPEQK